MEIVDTFKSGLATLCARGREARCRRHACTCSRTRARPGSSLVARALYRLNQHVTKFNFDKCSLLCPHVCGGKCRSGQSQTHRSPYESELPTHRRSSLPCWRELLSWRQPFADSFFVAKATGFLAGTFAVEGFSKARIFRAASITFLRRSGVILTKCCSSVTNNLLLSFAP